MGKSKRNLDKIEKDTKKVQQLARKYQRTKSAREASRISKQMADVSARVDKELRVQKKLDDYEKKVRSAG